MSLQLLFDHLDDLVRTPEDVARLEAAILDLAVRGKLVRQEEGDEPADLLVQRIRAKRATLQANRQVDRQRSIDPVRPGDYPFDLPEGWCLVRLSELASKLGAGSTPLGGKAVYETEGIKFIRSQNVWNDGLYLDDIAYITTSTHERMANTVVKPGDLLLNITGASIGRSAIVPDDFDEANVSQHVAIIRLVDPDIRQFIHLCLISPYIQATIHSVEVGISREGLSMSRLQHFILPLPPLAEQRRIVAKVDELLVQTRALAANLRRAQGEIVTANQAALHRLASAEDGASLQAAWHTLAGSFDLLYDDPRPLAALRQAILQLAVRGKLVRQEEGDEPAEELVSRIRSGQFATEVTKRSSARKRADSGETHIASLPPGWAIVRVSDIGEVRLGRQRAPQYHQGDYMRPYMRAANITWSGLDLSDIMEMDFPPGVFEAYELKENDILLNEASGSAGEVGKAVIWKNEVPNCCFQNTIIRVRLYGGLWPDFVRLHFIHDARTGRFGRNSKGIGINHLGAERLADLTLYLPPLAEQRRIVAKVDELLALCDALEQGLGQAAAVQRAALEAVLARV